MRLHRPLSVFLLSFIIYTFQAQTLEWASTMGGDTGDDIAKSIAIDGDGNVYTAGYFHGTVDFDPSAGVSVLSSNGREDIFVHKFNTDGDFQWVRQVGSTESDRAQNLSIDSEGNIYITGEFTGTVDFDPRSGIFNLVGSEDVLSYFIQKLDSNGQFIWAKAVTEVNQFIRGFGITIDDQDNIYTTGVFGGTVDFNPNVGTTILTATATFNSFIKKMDVDGNFIWAKNMGDIRLYHWPNIDAFGNILLSGSYFGSFPVNNSDTLMSQNGSNDALVIKMDTDANILWAKSMGGNLYDRCLGVTTDEIGNIYTVGSFRDTADFDPGPGVFELINTLTVGRGFVQKLDPNGNFVWAKSSRAAPRAITTDDENQLYIIGSFQYFADFDLNAGEYILEGSANGNFYIQKLDTDANLIFAMAMPATSNASQSIGYAIEVAEDGNIYAGGNLQGSADFDPTLAEYVLTGMQHNDFFVSKFNQCATNTNDIIQSCDNYTWIDGNTYTESNFTARHVISSSAGCDSVHILNLTITNSDSAIDIITACDSLTWIDGNTYTENNNDATFILANSAGCDSIVTLDLTILHSSDSTVTLSVCDFYTWIDGNTYTESNSDSIFILTNSVGCDSIITLDLTILNPTLSTDTLFACDSITWIDGITYTEDNNVATVILINSVGCDSIITLDLTISNSLTVIHPIVACDTFTWIDGNTYTSDTIVSIIYTNVAGCDSIIGLDLTIENVDINVSNTGNDLTANLSGGTYQWLDCSNNFAPIPGAIGQTFSATENGSYAVAITSYNNCTGTSDCVAISVVDTEDLFQPNLISIFPNPNNGFFNIRYSGKKTMNLMITDILGKVVFYEAINAIDQRINLSHCPNGIYHVAFEKEAGWQYYEKIVLLK